jgi:hypothetical protein
MIQRLVQCCLSVDDGQDKDVGNERQKVEHNQGQGEPVLPAVNAWESHQNELRDLELKVVGISEKLEQSGKSLVLPVLRCHYDIIIKWT